MRLIILLMALLIVGLLVRQQLGEGNDSGPSENTGAIDSNVPEVPTKPKDVKQFEKELNQFMEDEMAEKEDRLNKATE